ncbi:MAG TPA: MBL fold metallo-hydrolase [Burkholderiaceae bacterium]|jgi:glyoxylase-like metal-dependent hydrolase (beta-lactamase superfamily II)
MRRPLLAARSWLGRLVLAGLALATPMAQAGDPAPIELASGVYMVPGSPGEPDASNQGRIGNAGFIVGPTGVLAIDTGTSYLHGRALLAAIHSVTDRPVRLAIVTHTRQEFLFGAAAFREQGIPVAMQQAAAGLMATRCDTCLKTLRTVLGEDAMRGTTMFTPDTSFTDPLALNAAALIGRPIQLLYFGHSSGPGDIAVYDPRTRTLFAGGLLDARRIPDVIDSDLAGWSEALRSLRALPIEVIVPGHGPDGDKRMIGQVERYLDQLTTRVRALLQAGAPLSEVPDATSLPDFAAWDQYDTVHRRNAAVVYLRYEREQLIKAPSGASPP